MTENKMSGYNCGQCGYPTCNEFEESLKRGESLEKCPFHEQSKALNPDEGIIDGLKADFRLKALPNEPSCREMLYAFDQGISLNRGNFIKYRPLGCPVVHFAKILDIAHKILTVHIVGPMMKDYYDIGVCMVAGFEGIIVGNIPKVCDTVTFIPNGCMMQKVHSGVIVRLEGDFARIEGIDLKVWEK